VGVADERECVSVDVVGDGKVRKVPLHFGRGVGRGLRQQHPRVSIVVLLTCRLPTRACTI